MKQRKKSKYFLLNIMFSRLRKINLSQIKQIELLASKVPDVVSFGAGVPSFDTPEVVKKAAIKALNREWWQNIL